MTLEVKNCWRTCGRCDGYGCRECYTGEVPCCPSCSESPDTYRMTMADADAWVDDVIAHGGNCPECMRVKKTNAAYADEMAALGFGEGVEVETAPAFDHEASPTTFFDDHDEGKRAAE